MTNEVTSAFKTGHDNSRLTPKELQNIYTSYSQYGESYLSNFIQAIWEEAYNLGKEDALRQKP